MPWIDGEFIVTPSEVERDRELRRFYERWQAAKGTDEEFEREQEFTVFVLEAYP